MLKIGLETPERVLKPISPLPVTVSRRLLRGGHEPHVMPLRIRGNERQ
jgi:hypothetical protein